MKFFIDTSLKKVQESSLFQKILAYLFEKEVEDITLLYYIQGDLHKEHLRQPPQTLDLPTGKSGTAEDFVKLVKNELSENEPIFISSNKAQLEKKELRESLKEKSVPCFAIFRERRPDQVNFFQEFVQLISENDLERARTRITNFLEAYYKRSQRDVIINDPEGNEIIRFVQSNDMEYFTSNRFSVCDEQLHASGTARDTSAFDFLKNRLMIKTAHKNCGEQINLEASDGIPEYFLNNSFVTV